jgi:hypothetical protein
VIPVIALGVFVLLYVDAAFIDNLRRRVRKLEERDK